LNIRGSDIPYCPFVISYLILTQTSAHWFVDKDKLSPELCGFLKESLIEILPYNQVHQHIQYMADTQVKQRMKQTIVLVPLKLIITFV
jgi:Xaa-Pro aminopeptidase